MRVGGDSLKDLKRWWNRKEGKGNKDLKKVGQVGSISGRLTNYGRFGELWRDPQSFINRFLFCLLYSVSFIPINVSKIF